MLSISIIIPNFNNAIGLEKCLKSIREQDYRQQNLEILVADGGSTDDSQQIIHKYHAIYVKENSGSPESAKAIALKRTKFPYILFLATDNILPTKNWLKQICQPLSDNTQIIASYPLRYSYRHCDTSLNRYFALTGANDPVPYFLHKNDRQDYLVDLYKLKGTLIAENNTYFTVSFNSSNMPTLGDNGFLIRKDVLSKSQTDPQSFFHIDAIFDLVEQNYDTFAVVKNDIIHESAAGFLQFLDKRLKYMQCLYLDKRTKRRYFVARLDRDFLNLVFFSIYSLTLICPLIYAIRAYIKVRDIAWFWHPLMCFCHFWIYAYAFIKYWLTLRIRGMGI